MSRPSASELLRRHSLRSTPARRAVVEHLHARRDAATAAELEAIVDADRVTTYRTLRAFEESGLVHRIQDGSDSGDKYALCGDACSPSGHAHAHAHFHCSSCARTYCLRSVSVSLPEGLPAGYQVHAAHLTYQGACADCKTPVAT